MLYRNPREFSDAAPASNLGPEAYYRMGLACATGLSGRKDYVSAHMWFNLAALSGHEDAWFARRSIAEEMSPEEIAQAQRRARAWLARH